MGYSTRVASADPSNYDTSRAPIDTIIIHHAASTSFESIRQTFQNPARDASAHYAVGRNNNVDIMVPEQYTAWHCGNYPMNQRSIGIENVNSSGAPHWEVAPETKNTLVELCADIVRRNPRIGRLVPGKNLFGHKQVASAAKPTACPVILIDFLPELANRVNAAVFGGSPAPAPNPQPSRKSDDQIANEVIAGLWGNGDDRKARLARAGYDYGTIQGIVNRKLSGGSSVPARKSNDTIADEVLKGYWGNGQDRVRRLQAAGYDYNAVQNLVNQKLGGGSAPSRKSNETVAREVVRGDWGNGDERRRRLQAAGYDYNAVQAIVNRLV